MTLTSKLKQAERASDRLTSRQEKDLIRNYQLSLKEIRGKIAKGFEKHGPNYSEWAKYNRLSNLEKDIGKEIGKLTGKNAVNLKTGIARQFEDQYYRTAYAMESTAQAKLGFGKLDPKVIEAAIANPLDRVGFLKRNRDNQQRLARQLREQLTQGLIKGEGYRETARRIKKRMEVGATNVLRIAATENHRAQTQGRKKSFQQAKSYGVEMDEIWTSTLDDVTREDHQDMDGKVANEEGLFDLDGDLVEGPGLTGIAEQDINCRCAIRAEIKGYDPELRRGARTEGEYDRLLQQKRRELEGLPESKKKELKERGKDPTNPKAFVSRSEVIPYDTYNEWKKNRIDT